MDEQEIDLIKERHKQFILICHQALDIGFDRYHLTHGGHRYRQWQFFRSRIRQDMLLCYEQEQLFVWLQHFWSNCENEDNFSEILNFREVIMSLEDWEMYQNMVLFSLCCYKYKPKKIN